MAEHGSAGQCKRKGFECCTWLMPSQWVAGRDTLFFGYARCCSKVLFQFVRKPVRCSLSQSRVEFRMKFLSPLPSTVPSHPDDAGFTFRALRRPSYQDGFGSEAFFRFTALSARIACTCLNVRSCCSIRPGQGFL
jgi:hypothetical protein